MTSPAINPGLSGSANSHSRLSPSSAKAWCHCTAQPAFLEANEARIFPLKVASVLKLTSYLKSMPAEELYPHELRGMALAAAIQKKQRTIESLTESERSDIWKTEGSEASREGTRAHDFAEAILSGRKALTDIPGEFRVHVGTYVAHCQGLVPEGVIPYAEAKVPLFYSDKLDDTGTCDFCVVTDDRITIRDLKYGAGVLVDAIDNEQLAIYARSFIVELIADGMFNFGPETIVDIGIVQPRHHAGNEIKTWEITLADLRAFCAPIAAAAKLIQSGADTVFAPSEDACRWCDAKAFCAARTAALTDCCGAGDVSGFDYLAMLPDLSKADAKLPVTERIETRTEGLVAWAPTLQDDQLLAFWNASKGIAGMLADVDEYINDRALLGDTLNGEVKLVQGREGNRAWKNEDDADTFLRGQKLKEAERYDFKLKGPAKIEVLLKEQLTKTRTANRFAELISRSEGKLVAVPASDPREAATCAFDEVPLEAEPLEEI